MSELPSGWVTSRLQNVVSIEMGQSPPGSETNTDPSGYPLIGGAADFRNGTIITSRYTSKPTKISQAGDIILCIRATIGKAAFAKGEFCLGRGVAGLRPLAIDPKLLIYFLQMEAESLEQAGTGTTFRQIDKETLLNWLIKVPPLAEQHRIAAKLDQLFAHTRRAREELRKIPPLVEHYKQAILAAAFSGDLTADWRRNQGSSTMPDLLRQQMEELRCAALSLSGAKRIQAPLEADWFPRLDLPANWIFCSVDQLVSKVQYGTSAKTSDELTDGIPVVRMGNIIDGNLDFTNLKYLSRTHDEFPDLLLVDGDVLFNRTNSAELVGKTAVYRNDNAVNQASFASYLIRLQTTGILPELLSAYINSPYGREWVASVASQQVGQANVNGTKLRQLAIPVMPPEEQKEIYRQIESAFKRIELVKTEIRQTLFLLDHLEQATLSKAFRGELVPQDPNDEPASVLLDRIRAERAGQPNTRRSRQNRNASKEGAAA